MSAISATSSKDKYAPLADTFARLGTIPGYASAGLEAGLQPGVLSVAVTLSQRDLERKTKRTTAVTLTVQTGEEGGNTPLLLATTPAIDLTQVALQATSPDGTERAVLRSVPDEGSTTKKHFVEIWAKERLIKSIPVSDLHGGFYAEDTFGSLVWSPKGDRIVYVAEEKASEDAREKFNMNPDWGEKYSGLAPPKIFIVDREGLAVQAVHTPRSISPGQAVFSRDGAHLVYTQYSRDPRVFGIVFCPNRQTRIVEEDVEELLSGGKEGDAEGDAKATFDALSRRSPRTHPEGDEVYYLRNQVGGPHSMASELVRRVGGREEIVVPIVEVPGEDGFPGLFLDQLPKKCWLQEKGRTPRLVLSSFWRSRKTVLTVDVVTGGVHDETPEVASGSWTVLSVRDHYILAARSAPDAVPTLVLGIAKDGEITWSDLHTPSHDQEDLLAGITWEVQAYPERHPGIESVLIAPKGGVAKREVGGEKSPLLVFPHGGPHSCITTDFSVMCAGLAHLGFSVLLVNYTGSTGFGDKAVRDLVGRIGELEVQDTQYMAKKALDTGKFDADRTCLTGGSHGGFVSAHLLGKYPTFYKACVMRNPVINVGAMVSNTDIPDWCYAEAGIEYDLGAPPSSLSPERYSKMYAQSPASVADHVETPTLMMIGSGDRRVPPTEGMGWVHGQWSRGRGREEVQCKVYPKNGHGLDGAEAEAEGFVDLASFFLHWVKR